MKKEKSPIEKLFIDTKKPIYEVQIGEKSYVVNGKNMEIACKKAAKEHFGSIGVLIRSRKVQVKDNRIVRTRDGSWHYISSQYIYNNKLKEGRFDEF